MIKEDWEVDWDEITSMMHGYGNPMRLVCVLIFIFVHIPIFLIVMVCSGRIPKFDTRMETVFMWFVFGAVVIILPIFLVVMG